MIVSDEISIFLITIYKDENKNLNLLSDNELEKVKKSMDVNFEANQVTKDDEGFKYDTREEFNPTAPSGWDSDESFWFIFLSFICHALAAKPQFIFVFNWIVYFIKISCS